MLAHPRDGDHTAEAANDALIRTMLTLPAHLRGSLTWDQGAEMARHKASTIATDIPVSTFPCTSAIPHPPGNVARTRTPMGFCVSSSPKAPTCPRTGKTTSTTSPKNSTAGPRQTLGWDNPAERLTNLLFST
jgi:transposase, IS30 family